MGGKLTVKFILTIILAFALSVSLKNLLNINIDELKVIVGSFGIYAPAVYTFLLLLGLSVPFNPLPDYLLVNLAAFLFPAHIAIIATFFAHSFAVSINYLLARKFGWFVLDRITSKAEDTYLHKLSREITPPKIFWMRWLLPLTAIGIDIVSYAAGLAKLSFTRFYILSLIPWTTLNILFFVSTNFVIEKFLFFFFVPGLILVAIPLSLYSLYKLLGSKNYFK